MLCRRRAAAASLVGVALVTSVIGATDTATAAAPPPPRYEAWTASGGWRPLPTTASNEPSAAWGIDLVEDSTYAVAGGLVVVAEIADAGTAVRSVDPATGRDRWRTHTAMSGDLQVVVDPTAETVLVAAIGPDGRADVSLLAADKGDELWSAQGLAAVPGPQRFDTLAILATADGSVAIDTADGTVRWSIAEQVTAYPDVLVFHTEADPAGAAGRFGVVDPTTGAVRWELDRPPGAIASAPSGVVILSHDEPGELDSLVGLDAVTGDRMWEEAAAPLLGNSGAWPLGSDGTLFGGSGNPDVAGSLVALDAAGTVLWDRAYHKPGGLAMWRFDGRQFLYTRTAQGVVEVVDASTAELAGSSADLPDTWPAMSAGLLYFGGAGDVTAVAMESLQPLWTVPAGTTTSVVGAVDGGFVVAEAVGAGGIALSGFVSR
jgi:outer membrane protein assembly factor BamB